MTPSRLLVSCALLGLTAACAGPHQPLKVGVSEVASDIVLGAPPAQPVVVPVPLPPNALPLPSLEGFGAPPPPELPERQPVVAPVACPTADPLSVPALEATSSVALPPAPATYAFRDDGTFEVSGANTVKGRFPSTATRTVQAVASNGSGGFTYEVRAVLGTTATTTSYLLTPGDGGGVFIEKVVTAEYDKADPMDPKAKPSSQTAFTPTPALQLLSFPMVGGQSVTTRSVDPATGKLMALRSTVKVKARADLCGTLVDTQVIQVDGEIGTCTPPAQPPAPAPGVPEQTGPPCDLGSVSAQGERETFRGEYRVATQYGGLVVQDHVDVLTELPGGNVSRVNTAVMNRVPLAAAPAKG